jgi:hypothetical protein
MDERPNHEPSGAHGVSVRRLKDGEYVWTVNVDARGLDDGSFEDKQTRALEVAVRLALRTDQHLRSLNDPDDGSGTQ